MIFGSVSAVAANVLFKRVCAAVSKTTVPLESGIEIVLFCVGSSTSNLVINVLATENDLVTSDVTQGVY